MEVQIQTYDLELVASMSYEWKTRRFEPSAWVDKAYGLLLTREEVWKENNCSVDVCHSLFMGRRKKESFVGIIMQIAHIDQLLRLPYHENLSNRIIE